MKRPDTSRTPFQVDPGDRADGNTMQDPLMSSATLGRPAASRSAERGTSAGKGLLSDVFQFDEKVARGGGETGFVF